jgi:hypothetical protein
MALAAYRNFVETCRSPATRRMYSKILRYFMSFLRLSPGDYDKLLDKDPKTIQMDICDFVAFMKKEHSSATVTLYLAALNKFFAMNDITTLNLLSQPEAIRHMSRWLRPRLLSVQEDMIRTKINF